jgi:hypothetical protein
MKLKFGPKKYILDVSVRYGDSGIAHVKGGWQGNDPYILAATARWQLPACSNIANEPTRIDSFLGSQQYRLQNQSSLFPDTRAKLTKKDEDMLALLQADQSGGFDESLKRKTTRLGLTSEGFDIGTFMHAARPSFPTA